MFEEVNKWMSERVKEFVLNIFVFILRSMGMET